MAQRYEYRIISVKVENDVQTELQRVGQHGFRLVAAVPDTDSLHGYFVMERAINVAPRTYLNLKGSS